MKVSTVGVDTCSEGNETRYNTRYTLGSSTDDTVKYNVKSPLYS